MQFEIGELEAEGFGGWVTFDCIRRANPCPDAPGVYLVTHAESRPVSFASTSCGGWFKGKDPLVSLDALKANWVDEAEVVYIGMASNLRRRLREFAAFGAGKPIGHWGGRLIWQLPGITDLRVAWMETPNDDPRAIEARLLSQFRAAYGKPPFANDPHRLGA